MAIFETFSKRQKRLKGQMSDVFTYEDVPDKLRVQVCHIWRQAFGVEKIQYLGHNPIYPDLESTLAAEFGLFGLGEEYKGVAANIIEYFMRSANTEQALDMIETSFNLFSRYERNFQWKDAWHQELPFAEAIEDLNKRFLEHSVGYALIAGFPPQLIRKDNEHLHDEVVLPALHLLHENGFGGANDEYRKAHEHYRNGRQKECLNECLKAFESTMKTICAKKRWPHKHTDTASQLMTYV